VITGAGLLTPVGNDLETAWAGLLSGTSGAGAITQFETNEEYATRIACEVKGFDPGEYLDPKEVKRNDRFVQFAIAVADEAMESAGLALPEAREDIPPERFGVIIGSGIGGMYTFEDQAKVIVTKGPKRVSPFFVALRILQRGDADVMLAGGTEAAVTPLSIAGFSSMRAMSRRNDDPEAASRPFDAGRDGFVIGEGAGAMVLETLEHAQARGATILAELVGYGASADAYHITAPEPTGAGARFAMQAALKDAGAEPHDVDYINAHGTSTPHNDAMETTAIKMGFGDYAKDLVVSSTKSMVGHLLGAAGALEGIVCTLVTREGKIPPTINYSDPDPVCDLDYAPNRLVERPVALALSNSFGFGGHNVTLAIRRWEA